MSTVFSRQMAFAKKHEQEIINIINNECLMSIIKVIPTTITQDTKQATDLVIEVKGGQIGTRIRRYYTENYRDWTIRTGVYSKRDTEIDKLRRGWCDWYFYAWLNEENTEISSYILVDLNEVRKFDFLKEEYWKYKGWKQVLNKNPENTFIPIPVKPLDNKGCIVRYKLDRCLAEKLNKDFE